MNESRLLQSNFLANQFKFTWQLKINLLRF